MGVHLARGSGFHAADERSAVISDGYWRRHFGAADDAIGRHFRYGTAEFVVAGIGASEFRGASLEVPTDVWLPLDAVIPRGSRDRTRGRVVLITGRRRSGVTLAQMAAEASAILGKPIAVTPGATGYSSWRARLSRPLLLVQIVAALILLITCASLANLMLADTSARTRELIVRRAIGASRTRLVRQLIAESLTLAALGGAAALVVGYGLHGALLRLLPADQSAALSNLRFSMNGRLLAFTAAVAATTGLFFSLVPALVATSGGWAGELRAGAASRSPGGARASRALLVAQIALCVVMLTTGGVFLRSVHNLRSQPTGFRERGLLIADADFPPGYDQPRRKAAIELLAERLGHLPTVEMAAYSNIGQLSGQSVEFPVRVLGGPPTDSGSATAAALRISPRFFAAMGTALVAGRDFDAQDEARPAPVAVVNQEFVRRFLRPGNPLGQQFVEETGREPHVPVEIVGVVEDVKWLDLRERPSPIYYRPYWQDGGAAGTRFVLRSSGDLDALVQSVAREAHTINGNVILRNVGPFSAVVDGVLSTERLVSQSASVFGAIALALAAMGLFGVLAHRVNQRRREIAIRLVLGAQTGSVEAGVLRESFALLTLGCLIGIPASTLATRLGASMLFGVRANDPMTITIVIGVLAATTAAAAYVPARRAAGTDPALVLREWFDRLLPSSRDEPLGQ